MRRLAPRLLVANGAHPLRDLHRQDGRELLDRRRRRIALRDGVEELQRPLVVLRRCRVNV